MTPNYRLTSHPAPRDETPSDHLAGSVRTQDQAATGLTASEIRQIVRDLLG